ncbi:MAG: beta-glucosidase [Lachnospiraceae bacterium]|jgi:beta-glucosidase
MELKHQEILDKMTLEQKCALLSGSGEWNSRGFKKAGIPAMTLSDGPSGVRRQRGAGDHLGLNESVPATTWPSAATMANSWDPELEEQVGAALGEEAKALGVNVLLGPGLNTKRSPLGGRDFEYFSEDPYLAGKMAAACVRGVQSSGISACPKHFAANSQELRRMASNSVMDGRTLREMYLTGFEIAVKEGHPKAVMSSYNLVNGEYANENEKILREILRDEWGYEGIVVTDWGGSNDHTEGVRCGSDLEMPNPGLSSVRALIRDVRKGKLPEAAVDECADRLIDLALSTAIPAEQASGELPEAMKSAHHETARRAAEQTVVLLKNEGNLLPLAEGTSVTVIGEFAEKPRYQGSGSSKVNSTRVDTILEELKAQGSALSLDRYAQGYHSLGKPDEALADAAVSAAAEAGKKGEPVLFVFGLDEMKESEGADRTDMKINENQTNLLRRVAQANPRVIAVLCGGSAVGTDWASGVPAVVYCGLGGQAGAGAALSVISGRVNPSGRLSETFPEKYEDTPNCRYFLHGRKNAEYREGLYVGYRYYDTVKKSVGFPFGFGLSYTTFRYSGLTVTAGGAKFTVTNTGDRAGAETAQMYVHRKGKGDVFHPEQELKGFAKVALEPGESREVEIPFDEYTFRFFNTASGRWECDGGMWEIRVGGSSRDIALTADLPVKRTLTKMPYKGLRLSSYYTGRVQDVPDDEFAALLGGEIPQDKVKIDRNITFGQLIHGRSPIGWLVCGVLTLLMYLSEKKGERNLNLMFVYNMPLRALAKMTEGAFSMGMVDGLVMELKGFWVIGLVRTLAAFIGKLVKDAGLAKTLERQDS